MKMMCDVSEKRLAHGVACKTAWRMADLIRRFDRLPAGLTAG